MEDERIDAPWVRVQVLLDELVREARTPERREWVREVLVRARRAGLYSVAGGDRSPRVDCVVR
jgi:hypothetical protein